MLRTTFFKILLIGLSITAIFISPYAIAEKSKDIVLSTSNSNQDATKKNDYTLESLKWLLENGKKQVAEAYYKMAIHSLQQGNWGKAGKLIDEAVKMEPLNQQYLRFATHIAYNQHDYKMAETYLLNLINAYQTPLDNNPVERANLLDNLVIIYKSQNQINHAKKILKESLSIDKANTGSQYPKLVQRLYRMTELNMYLGDYGDAVLQMERAIQVLNKNSNKNSKNNIAKAFHNIGDIYRVQKFFNEAEMAYLKALKLWQENTEQGKSGNTLTRKSLAVIHTAQRNKKRNSDTSITLY